VRVSWQPELDQLKQRQTAALALGGPEKVARHTGNGKLTVRQRIAELLDADSFREIGSASGFAQYDADNQLASFTPTNQVMGRGRIEGRSVTVSATISACATAPTTAGCLKNWSMSSAWRCNCAFRWCGWSTAPAVAVPA